MVDYQGKLDDVADYTADAAAGSMAIAVIDFGNVKEDETKIGIGFGISSNTYGAGTVSSTALGVGLKYGIDDDTAAVAKAWKGSNGAYGAGIGGIMKF